MPRTKTIRKPKAPKRWLIRLELLATDRLLLEQLANSQDRSMAVLARRYVLEGMARDKKILEIPSQEG